MLVQRKIKLVEQVIRQINQIAANKKLVEETTNKAAAKNSISPIEAKRLCEEAADKAEQELKALKKNITESGHPDHRYIASLVDGLIYYDLSEEEVINLLQRLKNTI
ncbi:MAG: hypothetical protein J6K42_01865 [Clostridia bacterium]|nr:hypothetical protein [Clostridia bacterium]